MTTQAELRALADRVCAEAPSAELAWAVKRVMPNDVWAKAFSPLHNLSDAAAMMPAGWRVSIQQYRNAWSVHVFHQTEPFDGQEAEAPTEPRARTAAALRVRAAMMEDGE